jgi:hypothetical protein
MVSGESKDLLNGLYTVGLNYWQYNMGVVNELLPLFKHLEKGKKEMLDDVKSGWEIINVAIPAALPEFIKSSFNNPITYYSNIDFLGETIEVFITGNTEDEINKYKNDVIDRIMYMLYFLKKDLTKNKGKLKKVSIYLSDHKKEFFRNIDNDIEQKDVNTGYATHDGQVVLYRKEELLKVLVHELIHALQFDREIAAIEPVYKKHKGVLSHKTILITETFTEFWACVINCYLVAEKLEDTSEQVFCRFIHYLECEVAFSIIQMLKFMMSLHWIPSQTKSINTLTKQTDKHTNVFSYYFLKTHLLMNIQDFICLTETKDDYVIYKSTKKRDRNVLSLLLDFNKEIRITYYKYEMYASSLRNRQFNKELSDEKKRVIYKLFITSRMTCIELL